MIKRILKPGEGLDNPNEGGLVDGELKGFLEGQVFDYRDFRFILAEGQEENIPIGVSKFKLL